MSSSATVGGGVTPRLALIGLDLGDLGLIEAWIASGDLPNIARLRGEGVLRRLRSSAEILHVSAWPSLYTGVHPGEHGVYFTFQPEPGRQGHRRFFDGLYGRPTFWRLLADAGVACTVFDAPYTQPELGPGLTQVIDWGAWARYLGYRTVPDSLARPFRRAVGQYPVALEAHDVGFDAIAPAEIGPLLERGARARVDAALWLLDAHPAAVFVVVFGETHAATHYCWPDDPSCRDSSDLGALAAGGHEGIERLRGVYREIDAGIGRILDRLPRGTTVCLFSPDSARARYGGWHLLPEALRRLGYLVEPVSSEDDGGGKGGGLVRGVRDLLPRDLRKSLARRLPTSIRDRLARQVDTAFIDWERTRAFCLPTDLEGCIRINLAGREPQGIVDPSDYEATCRGLAEALSAFEDPATGRRVIREVVVTRDVMDGAKVDHLPDLVVLWEDALDVGEMRSADAGLIAGPSPDARPGTHGAAGFALASGPDAEAVWGRVADVRDVAGAVLATFGVDAAAGTPGVHAPRAGDDSVTTGESD